MSQPLPPTPTTTTRRYTHKKRQCPVVGCPYYGGNLKRHMLSLHPQVKPADIPGILVRLDKRSDRGPPRKRPGRRRPAPGLRFKHCTEAGCQFVTTLLRRHLKRRHGIDDADELDRKVEAAVHYQPPEVTFRFSVDPSDAASTPLRPVPGLQPAAVVEFAAVAATAAAAAAAAASPAGPSKTKILASASSSSSSGEDRRGEKKNKKSDSTSGRIRGSASSLRRRRLTTLIFDESDEDEDEDDEDEDDSDSATDKDDNAVHVFQFEEDDDDDDEEEDDDDDAATVAHENPGTGRADEANKDDADQEQRRSEEGDDDDVDDQAPLATAAADQKSGSSSTSTSTTDTDADNDCDTDGSGGGSGDEDGQRKTHFRSGEEYFAFVAPETPRHEWLTVFYRYLGSPFAGGLDDRSRLQHASQMKTLLEHVEPGGDDVDCLSWDEGNAVWNYWVEEQWGEKAVGTIKAYLCSLEKFLECVLFDRVRERVPFVDRDTKALFRSMKEGMPKWRRLATKICAGQENDKMVRRRLRLLTDADVDAFLRSSVMLDASLFLQRLRSSDAAATDANATAAADASSSSSATTAASRKSCLLVRDYLICKLVGKCGTRPGALEHLTLSHFYACEASPHGWYAALVGEHKTKASGPAIVAFDDETRNELHAYVQRIRPLLLFSGGRVAGHAANASDGDDDVEEQQDHGFLFVNGSGTPFRKGTLGKRVTALWEKSKVRPDVRVSVTMWRKAIVTSCQGMLDGDHERASGGQTTAGEKERDEEGKEEEDEEEEDDDDDQPSKRATRRQGLRRTEEALRKVMAHSDDTAKRNYLTENYAVLGEKAGRAIERARRHRLAAAAFAASAKSLADEADALRASRARKRAAEKSGRGADGGHKTTTTTAIETIVVVEDDEREKAEENSAESKVPVVAPKAATNTTVAVAAASTTSMCSPDDPDGKRHAEDDEEEEEEEEMEEVEDDGNDNDDDDDEDESRSGSNGSSEYVPDPADREAEQEEEEDEDDDVFDEDDDEAAVLSTAVRATRRQSRCRSRRQRSVRRSRRLMTPQPSTSTKAVDDDDDDDDDRATHRSRSRQSSSSLLSTEDEQDQDSTPEWIDATTSPPLPRKKRRRRTRRGWDSADTSTVSKHFKKFDRCPQKYVIDQVFESKKELRELRLRRGESACYEKVKNMFKKWKKQREQDERLQRLLQQQQQQQQQVRSTQDASSTAATRTKES